MVRCESRPSTIGHITLDTKQTGAPSAGNPHAGCDVAGAGNGFTVWLLRHSQRKRGETARPDLRNTTPVLDPTGMATEIRKTFPALKIGVAFGFFGTERKNARINLRIIAWEGTPKWRGFFAVISATFSRRRTNTALMGF